MDLTVIGFIIAVVGIVLQLSDAFPDHPEVRKALVYLAIGVFLGIVASAALGARYEITGNVDRRFALLFSLAGMAAVFGTLATFMKDEPRRKVAILMTAIFGAGFVMTGFVVMAGSSPGASRYSSDEILLLANSAEQKGQYETAIERLGEFKQGLPDEKAQQLVEERIDALRRKQVRMNPDR